MSAVEKKMLPGEVRFIVRARKEGPRTTKHFIYDRALGSEPGQREGIGKVKQGLSDPVAAQTEANRLNAYYGSNA